MRASNCANFVVTALFTQYCINSATPTVNLNLPDPFQYIVDQEHKKNISKRKSTVGENVEDESPSVNWTKAYDPHFAALALEFASAAYALDPTECATKHDAVIEKVAKIPCDYWNDQCWVFIARTQSLITLSIRGTRTRLQLILELVETMSEPKKTFPSGGSVQHYFYTALQHIWNNGFGVELRRLRIKYPHCKLLFTGHSLGGALSSLAATLFAYENADLPDFDSRKDVYLITFGQPRAGNKLYAAAHDLLVPNSWRLIHRYDIVAHLPYCYEDFKRQCTPLHNHGPFHHGTEIWYPETMDIDQSLYRVCKNSPINEDQTCSNGYYIHYGINDHLYYFEKDVDFYGSNGCRENVTLTPSLLPGTRPHPEFSSTEEDESANKTKHWPRRRRLRKHKRDA